MKNDTINSHCFTGIIRTALLVGAGMALVALAGCGQSSGNSQSMSISDPTPGESASAASVSGPASSQTAPVEQTAAPAAPSADHGQQLFTATCTGCHGAQGQGVPHLGKDLQTSQFVSGLSDAQLADFITQGRAVTDPMNTTHVPMPPKGGNPALSSQDIGDIVAYVRQLQHEHSGSK